MPARRPTRPCSTIPASLYLFKGRIRVIDSITIPWQGRIPPERAFNMGYFDARAGRDARQARRGHSRDVPAECRHQRLSPGERRLAAAVTAARVEVGQPRRRHARLAEEGEAGGHRRAAPAARYAQRSSVHDGRAVRSAGAVERPVTLLLYTNHADGNRYPYGPCRHAAVAARRHRRVRSCFDRVYSHPVSPSLQRLKLFALESMHDLRFSPTRQYQLARHDARAMAPEKIGPEPDITYLRRGAALERAVLRVRPRQLRRNDPRISQREKTVTAKVPRNTRFLSPQRQSRAHRGIAKRTESAF